MSSKKDKAPEVEMDGRMVIHNGVRYRRREAEKLGLVKVETTAAGPGENRARTADSAATGEGSSTPPVEYKELQARAKALGVPATGSSEELAARVADAEKAAADGGASGAGVGSGDGSSTNPGA
jgi:hypothetical protein